MDVSYYPGCSLHGTSREYGESTESVVHTLGVNFKELPDWTCCGASSAHITSSRLSVGLPARNLAIADKVGLELVIPCASCFQRTKFAEKEALAGHAGISYGGKIKIKHLADFLWDDVGDKVISGKVKRPLTGLNPVCYYGCVISRPPRVTDAGNPEDPQSIDNIARALGANVKNWSYKTDCCGAGHSIARADLAHKLIQKLIDMAKEAGANCIITACPLCQSNLDSVQADISLATGKEYNMPLFYITEAMGIAFGDPSVNKWLGRHLIDPRPLLREKGLI